MPYDRQGSNRQINEFKKYSLPYEKGIYMRKARTILIFCGFFFSKNRAFYWKKAYISTEMVFGNLK